MICNRLNYLHYGERIYLSIYFPHWVNNIANDYFQSSESDVGLSSDDSDQDKNCKPDADDQEDDEEISPYIALMNDAPSSPDFIECFQDVNDLDDWVCSLFILNS
jgi:hypothetical protein